MILKYLGISWEMLIEGLGLGLFEIDKLGVALGEIVGVGVNEAETEG